MTEPTLPRFDDYIDYYIPVELYVNILIKLELATSLITLLYSGGVYFQPVSGGECKSLLDMLHQRGGQVFDGMANELYSNIENPPAEPDPPELQEV